MLDLLAFILTFEIISRGNGSWSRFANQLYRRWTRQWSQLDGAPLTVVDWDFANQNGVSCFQLNACRSFCCLDFLASIQNFRTSWRRRRKIAFIPPPALQLIAITWTWAASFWQLNKSLSRQLDMCRKNFSLNRQRDEKKTLILCVFISKSDERKINAVLFGKLRFRH